MVGISSLLESTETFGDTLRYSEESRHQLYGTHQGYGPVVVWNVTRTCNLHCLHCYADADAKKYEGELSHVQAIHLIDELAAMRVPVILFSGGEPLARKDVLELAEYAIQKGIRVTFSTNGTLVTVKIAKHMKKIGVSYVGISLDGIGEIHDHFRQKKGAYQAAMNGIRNCQDIDQKVGLRFTMNRHNIQELPAILELIEEKNIPRACFYHLVYSGRGSMADDISHEETRQALDLIIEKSLYFKQRGKQVEILTVDNHADGVYLYLKMKQSNTELADNIYDKLHRNGGNRSGIAVCDIDSQGNVHPDQFNPHIVLGNIKETSFIKIWMNHNVNPILDGLRNRKTLLRGRCANCQFLDLCNGNFRPRGYAVSGNYWASDPQCYLTDQEIGL